MNSAESSAKRSAEYPELKSSDVGGSRPVLSIHGMVAAVRHPMVVAFLSLAALFQVYRTALALPGRIHEEDFADYYSTAIIMREGKNPCRTPLASAGSKLGLHPKAFQKDEVIPETPAFLLVLRQLGALPLTDAYWTWVGINFTALIASFYLLLNYRSGFRPIDCCLMIALALMYPPLIDLFLTAQSQVLVILGLAVTVRCLDKNRDNVAGLVLAALAILRGYPVLMGLYLLLTRKWRALTWMAAGTMFGILLCTAVLGWRVMVDFPLGLAATGGDREFFRLSWNTAPASLLWRLCFYLNGWRLGQGGDRFARALGYVASAAFMVLTLTVTFRRSAGSDRDWRIFALWVVTSIEILPVSWLNYNTLLFVPFALIASAATHRRVSERTIWAAVISYFLSQFAFGGLVFLNPRFPIALFVLVGESKSFAVMAGYLSAYWFALDEN